MPRKFLNSLLAACLFCFCAWGQQSQIVEINQALAGAAGTLPASPAWVSLLLSQRARFMASLIESDPAMALAVALPAGIAAQLHSIAPDAEIESQGEWEGWLEATVADDFERHRSRRHWVLRTKEDATFEVHFVDPAKARAGTSVKLRGISTAGRIAAASLAAATTVAAAPQRCTTLGTQNIAVLMVATPANPTFPSAYTPASVQQAFFGNASDPLTTDSLNGMWHEMSFGLTSAAGHVYGPFSLSQNYTCDQSSPLALAAISAADPTVDFTQFTRIAIMFPVSSCTTYSGMDTIGCIPVFSPTKGRLTASEGWFPILPLQTLLPTGLFAHELGHGLGLDHSSSDDYNTVPLGPLNTPGTLLDYGDPFSLMGYPYGSGGLAGQYTAEHKSLILHWLNPGDYQEVRSSGTFTLAPYESSSGLRALRILRDGPTNAWLWLEYRQPMGDIDKNLQNLAGTNVFNGALIHYEDPTLDHAHTYLLDFTPVSAPNNFVDAALAAGRSWADPYSPLILTVNSATSGGTTSALSVTVTYTNNMGVPPALAISKTHIGTFAQGQIGALYTVSVSNGSAAGPTGGTVTVTETLPSGLSLVSMNGTGWSCASNTCSRSDVLNGGASYPVITVNVNVAAGATSPQVNAVNVSGGGSATASTTDSTVITLKTSMPPFGVVDTPARGATGLAGAINFTGWALSQNTVATVALWREPVNTETPTANGLIFLGTAPQVPGARPDVALAHPGYPNNNYGWGAQILTNQLPGTNGLALGNGTYKLHAIATDPGGLTADLGGAVTITVNNASSTLPFGTIDTPGPGATVSGTAFANFGWVLTPQPNIVPVDASTIAVVIDGVAVGHPVYNQFRSDIATLFPAYRNSNGAVGAFILDTTKLTNGRHNIAWGVIDSAGNTQGIGSRDFFVQN